MTRQGRTRTLCLRRGQADDLGTPDHVTALAECLDMRFAARDGPAGG